MLRLVLRSFLLALAASPLLAQAGSYHAELLGPGVVVNDMNLHGQAVGWTTSVGVVQALLVQPGQAPRLLTPPAGHASAWAQGINDSGVVVGSSTASGFPEFGQPAVWTPDGQGGYVAALLPLPAGFTQGVAYDVNNRGDIVGNVLFPGFQGGPTTWFNAPGGPLEIASLGAPGSPKEVNDEGVVVGINGGLFDLDTLTATPLPSFDAGMTGFQGWGLNDAGELAGTVFHGGVSRTASTWTAAAGWSHLTPAFSLSANVTAFDINNAGVTMFEGPAPQAWFPGRGVFGLASLLEPAQTGQWSFFLSFGGAVNDAGQLATTGTGPGGTGVVLLSPVDPAFVDLGAGLAGSGDAPRLAAGGEPQAGGDVTLSLQGGLPGGTTHLVLGLSVLAAPFKSGTLVPNPDVIVAGLALDAAGGHGLDVVWPSLPSGTTVVLQHWLVDPGAPAGFAASNALVVTQP